MYGLYDTDGILRFMGGDREACEAYAALFSLPLASCSLLPMPRPATHVFRKRRSRREGARSS
ncbi:MAG: hypothetical protein CBD47_00145 [Synechococcus sp. TMED187]|nr:hypothetical protein [Synechococcus sp. NAT40]OUW50703.1 MAG: hypothetical protein CBD47_00145 [Synechococcus sp. TMED187]